MPPPAWASRLSSHTISPVTDGAGGYFAGTVTPPSGVGAMNWMFAVPDPRSAIDGSMILSVEEGNTLFIGVLDLSSLSEDVGDPSVLGTVVWVRIDASIGLISDHWHIWTQGYHWICYQASAAVHLIRITIGDIVDAIARGGDVTPADTVTVYSDDSAVSSLYNTGGTGSIVTNDMLMMRAEDGVVIGLWRYDNNSLQMLTVDASLALVANVEFAGGREPVGTTGSGIGGVDDRGTATIEIMAPEYIASSKLKCLETTDSFASASLAATIEDTTGTYRYLMPTFFRLENGDTVVTYKQIPVSAEFSDGSEPRDDEGSVIREIYDSFWGLVSGEVVLEAGETHAAERPHMSRWNRYVITCWDHVNAGAFVGWYLRIDLLEGAP